MNKFQPSSIIKLGLYLLLALVSFVVFLYVTFPYETLRSAIISQVEQNSGAKITIKEISPALPLGLKSENLLISHGIFANEFPLKSSSVEVPLSSLLFFSPSLKARLQIGSGNIAVNGNMPDEENIEVDTSIEDVDLSDISKHLKKDLLYVSNLGGILNGNIDVFLQENALLQQQNLYEAIRVGKKGEGEIQVKNGSFQVALLQMISPSFPNAFSFDNATAKFVLENNLLSLSSVEITGKDFHALINGHISLKPVFWQSDTNLTIKLKPTAHMAPALSSFFQQMNVKKDQNNFFSFMLKGSVSRITPSF